MIGEWPEPRILPKLNAQTEKDRLNSQFCQEEKNSKYQERRLLLDNAPSPKILPPAKKSSPQINSDPSFIVININKDNQELMKPKIKADTKKNNRRSALISQFCMQLR